MRRAFGAADIMLPKSDITKRTWAVNACDQFTSEPEYWEQVNKIVGRRPSTLSMILPEVYLDDDDCEQRLNRIHLRMNEYLRANVFDTYHDAMIYVRRIDSTGKVREGVVGCIDLEEYEYYKASSSQVRASEATVPARLPSRVEIRKNASLELPHIMMLIDDKNKGVIEPCRERMDQFRMVYDFDLMLNGGHINGYLLDKEEQERILQALDVLGDGEHFQEKYHVEDKAPLLYAVGDGNHSLASAKVYYEQMKARNPEKDFSRHPARYALVELINLHSPALEFEAIHRIVKEVNRDHLIRKIKETFPIVPEGKGQYFDLVVDGVREHCVIDRDLKKLFLGSLQTFLDSYVDHYGGKIDYIHGDHTVEKLSMDEYSVGFILQDIKKEVLFPTILYDGCLPRKTFSMGHAQDKRYYLECRKIIE